MRDWGLVLCLVCATLTGWWVIQSIPRVPTPPTASLSPLAVIPRGAFRKAYKAQDAYDAWRGTCPKDELDRAVAHVRERGAVAQREALAMPKGDTAYFQFWVDRAFAPCDLPAQLLQRAWEDIGVWALVDFRVSVTVYNNNAQYVLLTVYDDASP